MNQKIQSLLDGGFISIKDILEYAQDVMDACDQLDDEQNKHIPVSNHQSSIGNIEAKFMEEHISQMYEDNDDLPF